MMVRCRAGVGVTADAIRRAGQHREGTGSRHVADFAKTRLAHVEHHATIQSAIFGDKLAKQWRRAWKFALIEAANPAWGDPWEQGFPPQHEPKWPSPVSGTGRRER